MKNKSFQKTLWTILKKRKMFKEIMKHYENVKKIKRIMENYEKAAFSKQIWNILKTSRCAKKLWNILEFPEKQKMEHVEYYPILKISKKNELLSSQFCSKRPRA